jgi:hypothetical protein
VACNHGVGGETLPYNLTQCRWSAKPPFPPIEFSCPKFWLPPFLLLQKLQPFCFSGYGRVYGIVYNGVWYKIHFRLAVDNWRRHQCCCGSSVLCHSGLMAACHDLKITNNCSIQSSPMHGQCKSVTLLSHHIESLVPLISFILT